MYYCQWFGYKQTTIKMKVNFIQLSFGKYYIKTQKLYVQSRNNDQLLLNYFQETERQQRWKIKQTNDTVGVSSALANNDKLNEQNAIIILFIFWWTLCDCLEILVRGNNKWILWSATLLVCTENALKRNLNSKKIMKDNLKNGNIFYCSLLVGLYCCMNFHYCEIWKIVEYRQWRLRKWVSLEKECNEIMKVCSNIKFNSQRWRESVSSAWKRTHIK